VKMPTGDQIKVLRESIGLTQQQLGEELRLPQLNAGRTVRRWEAGDRQPSGTVVMMLEILAKAARVKAPWL